MTENRNSQEEEKKTSEAGGSEQMPVQDETIAFAENPFSAEEGRKTSDLMRMFYLYQVPVIPVISKRGILLGILKKDAVISELSDIERASKFPIDEFITRLAVKPSFEEVLPYAGIKEFPVINIFGEEQGRWSRLQLLSAAEKNEGRKAENEIQDQQDEKIMEWIIYLILEHIPRPLYALNEDGKTIFYNSDFEDLYKERKGGDIDVSFMEKILGSEKNNQLLSSMNVHEFRFFNSDIRSVYEKIPMLSRKKRVGWLLFFDRTEGNVAELSDFDLSGKTLEEILSSVEKKVILHEMEKQADVSSLAKRFGIAKTSLVNRMKKLEIS